MPNSLAIDVGSTAIKLNVYNAQGEEILARAVTLTTYYGENHSVYQKPAELYQGLLGAIQELARTVPLDKISVSTAMHSLIVGERAYLWSDNQAGTVIEKFKQTALAAVFYQKTGTPIHAMSPFAKLLFFKETQPEVMAKTPQFLDLKAYLMTRMTGIAVVDYSVASATGLFNSETMTWDDEILTFLGITPEKLPQLAEPTSAFPASEDFINLAGVNAETKIIIGASDGCLASWASYLSTGSPISLTIGTSGAIRKITTTRQLAPNGEAFCYYFKKDCWVVGGPSNNGGNVLRWFGEQHYADFNEIYDQLTPALKNSPIGSDSLTFLPYVFGERAPFWEADEKPQLLDQLGPVVPNTNSNNLLRATFEGILFNLKFIAEMTGITGTTLGISGGFFKIPAAAPMLATIFNKTCVQTPNNEPTFGLQHLFDDGEVELAAARQTIQPMASEVAAYQEAYVRFRERALAAHNI